MNTTPRTVRANRALYASALADAIDWTESFLAAHNGEVRGQGHCDRGERCEVYRKDAEKLTRYRQAYSALVGKPEPQQTRALTLAEVAAKYPAERSL